MIQDRSLTKTAVLHTSTLRLMLVKGLSWIGSISVLGSGVALAQTPVAETIAPAPVQPAEPAPTVVAPIAPQPVPAAPESLPTEFSAPPSVPVPPLSVTTPPAAPPRSQSVDSYSAPGSIVFSERSTGCRAVLRSGQAPAGGICDGGMAAPTTSQLTVPGTVSQLSGREAVNVGSLGVNPLGLGLGTTPSVRDFYRRTMRPPAALGNGNIRLIFPLSIPAAISSVFGWRIHPITGDARFHTGTDIAAPMGTPVLAAYAGQVAIADFLSGYGLAIALQHNKNTQQTLYAHLSEVFVKPGEWVKQGEVIGRVGSTGNSTGPHLHFEFRQLTPDGWVALDAGTQLEYALAQLVRSMELAQTPSKAVKSSAGIQGVIGLSSQPAITSSRALPRTQGSNVPGTVASP